MSQKQVGVVILNYISYQVTEKCVESFQQQNSDNINVQIVVVDNCSPNESFEVLKEKYMGIDNITVVQTDKNLGFARGNNYGYKILKKIIDPDFVITSNSDIQLKMAGLYSWIFKAYQEYDFGILGPSVYSIRGHFHQNPAENASKNLHEVREYQRNLRRYLLKLRIKKFLKYEGKEKKHKHKQLENPYYKEIHLDKTLHGAFQIFSRRYLDIYDSLYDSRTFLYLEENILKLRCDYENLPMVYLPNYEVNHFQAVSTDNLVKTNYDKGIFRSKNLLESYKVYESILKKHLEQSHD